MLDDADEKHDEVEVDDALVCIKGLSVKKW